MQHKVTGVCLLGSGTDQAEALKCGPSQSHLKIHLQYLAGIVTVTVV